MDGKSPAVKTNTPKADTPKSDTPSKKLKTPKQEKPEVHPAAQNGSTPASGKKKKKDKNKVSCV